MKNQTRYILVVVVLIAMVAALVFFARLVSPPAVVVPAEVASATSLPSPTPVAVSKSIPIPDSPLKESVIAAGDYLVRQELPNGELSYQVDFMTGERNYSPSPIRLISGTGALYIVCRVSSEAKYCKAGDLALGHYLESLVVDPEHFAGACLYTTGYCELGGTALAVDTIYKRWQATGNFMLGKRDLLPVVKNLGYFIVSMRKPDGGFYHEFDPHYAGTVNPNYYVLYFPGESLLALTELYEMTGNEFWLKQSREVNDFMITQPVTEDHWHGYALSMLARLDHLTKADKDYGKQIADTVIAGEVRSLNPKNTSISTATKIEALAALAQAFYFSDEDSKWLDSDIRTLITFVRARQLPDNNCSWTISAEMTDRFGGGIFSACDDPSIRVDGLQHYINGVTEYLEYESLVTQNK